MFWLVRLLGMPLVFMRKFVWCPKTTLRKVEGVEQTGRLPLSILFGATGLRKNFFLGLTFGDSAREQEPARVDLHKIFHARPDAGNDGSLLVVESNKFQHALLNADNWFFIPTWVSGEIDLPVADKFLNDKSVKSDLLKIHKQGFEYEITRDEKRLADFYHNMHVPYISKIHGSAAYIDSYEEKRKAFRNCDLLLVSRQGRRDRPVAGSLIIYERAGPRLWSLGIRDGDLQHVRDGVIPALYHFPFQYLLAKGVSRIRTGNSRAFLNDGVLRFKRKMSQTITGSSLDGFALKILSYTPATKAFLLNNPFIFASGGILRGAVFTDSNELLSPEKVQQLAKDYLHPGLSGLVIYSFQQGEVASPDNLPSALSGRVVIRPACDLISRDT